MPAGNWLSEVLGFKSMSCNSTLLKFQNKINLFFPPKPEIVSQSLVMAQPFPEQAVSNPRVVVNHFYPSISLNSLAHSDSSPLLGTFLVS